MSFWNFIVFNSFSYWIFEKSISHVGSVYYIYLAITTSNFQILLTLTSEAREIPQVCLNARVYHYIPDDYYHFPDAQIISLIIVLTVNLVIKNINLETITSLMYVKDISIYM